MSTNFSRYVVLGVSVVALLLLVVVAYGRFRAMQQVGEECCLRVESSSNTEMPWEALARQWMGAVVL